MAEATQEFLRRINIPGVVSGVLTLMLPFLGTWWSLTLGTDAIVVNASPFWVETLIFGKYIASPLFEWFCLGLKLGIMYVGVLLIAGSILPAMNRSEAIAGMFVRFASRKLFWIVLAFVASLFVSTILLNQSSLILPVRMDIPYLVGAKTFSADIGNVGIEIPVSMKFTQAFGVAVIAAISGVYSRIYHEKP